MIKETKVCQNCKSPFIIEPDDFAFYDRIEVPPPTFCVECREQRRIAYRNERALYKRKCDLCGKDAVSRVSPDKPYPMYCRDCWWSDKWDPLSFGQEYDFSKPFFRQFQELLNKTPHISIFNSNTVNSDWVNQETDDKNCYLNVGGHYNEDSGYNTYELYGKNCFDNFWLLNSEFCYENLNCERCYRTLFSQVCHDCQDTILSYDCRNCSHVLGCAGLRNKKYHIFNQPYSKEEYEKFLKDNPLSSRKNIEQLKEKAEKVWLSIPRRYAQMFKTTNSTGDFVSESKNAKNCWNLEKVENAKNIYIGGWLRDGLDASAHGASELGYEMSSGGGVYNSQFNVFCMSNDPLKKVHSSNIKYCYAVVTSNSCFGCANLRDQEYCILNKKYSKEDYEKLLLKIKKQMAEMPYLGKNGRTYGYGEFFPIEIAPFGYNETAAQDYYPLTKEQAKEKGYPWCDYEPDTKYQFSDYEIPDNISEVGDDILQKILKCEISGKAYRIVPMELQFYRHMELPVPKRSPLERHKDRIAELLPRKLHKRTCECGSRKGTYQNTVKHFHNSEPCPNQIETPFAPDRPELVYCEVCYNSEIA